MINNLHYSKAPIVEAVIDLRVEIAEQFSVEDLQNICSLLEDDYPAAEKMYLLLGEYQFQVALFGTSQGDVSQASAEHQHIGYRLTSMDKHYVLHARLDGFALVVLKPYENWETFRAEAQHLWNIYRSLVPITGIKRAALRYINHLEIPATNGVELSDYLQTYPQISETYDHSDINGFFVQLQIPQPDIPCTLLLRQASLDPTSPEVFPILLDIDLFVEQYDPMWQPQDEDHIWDLLEKLRHRKNDIFKASINHKMEDLIA